MKESKTKTQATIPKPGRSTAGSLLRDPAVFARLVACNSDIGIAFVYHEACVMESFA
jgi:hypothetical protein